MIFSILLGVLFNFNFGWLFAEGEIDGAEALQYFDRGWQSMDLPHDYQINQPWDKTASGARGFKQMGTGWYRKHFIADEAWKGKRVLLDFEGMMLTGDVWVNGVKAGKTDYGYLGFESDITSLLRFGGQDNVVAVRTSTGEAGNSRWYTGGGINRNVSVVVKDSTAIRRHGLFITTPKISAECATIAMQLEMEGLNDKRLPLTVKTAIYYGGTQVGESIYEIKSKTKRLYDEFSLPTIMITAPKLWDCEHPNLYQAHVEVTDNRGMLIDSITERFGIRSVEFSPEYGMRLNGKKVFLKGVANHCDFGALGVAVYDKAIRRYMRKLKEFGFNHIRCSHNPYPESFLRIADEEGIIIVDELFDKWHRKFAGGRTEWNALWPYALPEWIKRDRNHPSVVMWSYGNETQYDEECTGYQTNDWGTTTYRILDVLGKHYDSTRPSMVAMFPAFRDAVNSYHHKLKDDEIFPPRLSEATDISAHNYTWRYFNRYRQTNPNLILYQSEAATYEMGKCYWGMDHATTVGLAYWGAVEYWGESSHWPKKGWNYSFFGRTLIPHTQAYFIQSMFEPEKPICRIGIIGNDNDNMSWNSVLVGRVPMKSSWNYQKGEKLNLVVCTNTDEVELLINGKSMGVQKNITSGNDSKRNTVIWTAVPYEPGTVTAIARKDGREVTRHSLQTTGKAVALKLIAEEPENFKSGGMDIQYVRAIAVDNKGRQVDDAVDDVSFCVQGNATLLAVDNSNQYTDEVFNTDHITLFEGECLAILRSSKKAGKVTLKAACKGMKTATITLKTRL